MNKRLFELFTEALLVVEGVDDNHAVWVAVVNHLPYRQVGYGRF